MKNLTGTCMILLAFFLSSTVAASPNSLTYQGRILKPDGTPLQYNNVSFLFEITSNNGTCVIYREQKNGINMTNSQGVFDVPIGTGSKLFPTAPTKTLLSVFDNSLTHDCADANNNVASIYTPTEGHSRLLRVQFHDGTGWKVISPDNEIRTTPYSAFSAYSATAQKLGTKTENDFVVKTGIPTCALNEFLKWSGSALVCAPVSGASGGTVTNIATGTGLTGGPITSTGTISLANTAVTPGSYARANITVDAQGRLTAASNSATINLATEVAGTLPIANGGTGQTSALAAFNALSPLTIKGDVLVRDGTNNIRLPVGTDGQVLSANSGQASGLQWVTPTNGTVTNVTGTAPIVVVTGSTTPAISINDATTGAKGAVQIGAGIAVSAGTISADPANFPSAVPVSKGGTGATIFTANRLIASNGTGNAFTTFNCAVGQLVTFDATGMMTCSTFTTGSVFLNGGNSFSGNASLGLNDNFNLDIKTNNITRMTVASSGNVGIGTTTPNGILHVAGAGWADQTVSADTSSFPTSGTAGIILDGNYSDGRYRTRLAKVDRGGNLGLYVQETRTTANTYANVARFGIHSQSTNAFEVFGNAAIDGNVGVGTTNPATTLEVAEPTGAINRGITSTTYATTNPGGLFQTRGARGTASVPTAVQTSDTFGWYAMNAHDGTAFSTQAQPTGVSAAATENWSATGHGAALRFTTTTNGATNGAERVRIDHNGNVGIGTTTPGQKLEVNGNALVTGNLFGSVKDTSGNSLRACTGRTPSNTWVYYSINSATTGSCGAYVDVNTSACGFLTVFKYFPSLGGMGGHWVTTGASSVYQPTATGFRIYINTLGGAYDATNCNASTLPHISSGWYIDWLAVGM